MAVEQRRVQRHHGHLAAAGQRYPRAIDSGQMRNGLQGAQGIVDLHGSNGAAGEHGSAAHVPIELGAPGIVTGAAWLSHHPRPRTIETLQPVFSGAASLMGRAQRDDDRRIGI